jgi:hypothetical protein
LFKRIFWRDGRICSTGDDYMRRTDGVNKKNKKTVKNNHNGKLGTYSWLAGMTSPIKRFGDLREK